MNEHKVASKNYIRQTVSFSPYMHNQIIVHGQKRGCQSFGETIRDLLRIALSSTDQGNNTDSDEQNQE